MFRGLRFQKRLRLLPGVRVNLSKTGASASIGPRGADVNIGSHGISANAGIPGTGLSYRTRLKKPGSFWVGAAALAVGLSFAAYKNAGPIGALFAPAPRPSAVAPRPSAVAPASAAQPPAAASAAAPKPVGIRAQAAKLLVAGGTIYVRRAGSVLRETEKPSGKTLKKFAKGAAVTVVRRDDTWTQVKDGGVTGWMRTSVLGPKPGG